MAYKEIKLTPTIGSRITNAIMVILYLDLAIVTYKNRAAQAVVGFFAIMIGAVLCISHQRMKVRL